MQKGHRKVPLLHILFALVLYCIEVIKFEKKMAFYGVWRTFCLRYASFFFSV